MLEILFWGASGQAKVLNEALNKSECTLVALVDNRDLESPIHGIPVLKGEAGLDQWLQDRGNPQGLLCAVAIGGANGHDRLQLMELLQKKGLVVTSIIHKAAFIASDAMIGTGCQVLAHASVCSHARLHKGVIVNTSASVDHDCIIGPGAHIAPGAHLAGEITVEANVFVGAGAIVLPRLTIGANSIVGAGAIVTKDIPPNVTVIGNPAKIQTAQV